MTILESTTYHDNRESMEPYLQLRVVSMWEFSVSPQCFRDGIGYVLEKHTPLNERGGRFEMVSKLTKEQQKALIAKGYSVAK